MAGSGFERKISQIAVFLRQLVDYLEFISSTLNCYFNFGQASRKPSFIFKNVNIAFTFY